MARAISVFSRQPACFALRRHSNGGQLDPVLSRQLAYTAKLPARAHHLQVDTHDLQRKHVSGLG